MKAPLYDPSTMLTFVEMMNASSVEERQRFVARLKAMPYKVFLQTPYWGVIRGWVMAERKHCRFCKSKYYLSVHHMTYEHFGEEWKYLEDLDLLCSDCHANEHRLASLRQIGAIYQRRLEAWRYPDPD